MRLSTSALVLGAATTVLGYQDQQVLGSRPPFVQVPEQDVVADEPVPDSDSIFRPEILEKAFGKATGDALEVMDEVLGLVPGAWDALKKHVEGTKPKPSKRRPDSEWDHVVKGADVESIWVETEGQKHRKVGGKLENYNLRARSVDPSKLGVDDVKQFSGYLDDEEQDKHLFYWFFESRNDPENDPVVLWLNGGPGCSSLTGLFFELGPATIDENIKVVRNPYSWNNNASVIFLDQPVNVGYSYSSGSVSSTEAASKDVYALLTLFFHQFPQYAKQDFHIAGESYAGHYVPVFSQEILSHKDRNINLKSALVGNGLTDGYTQYAYYGPMACGEGGYPAVLSESQCQSIANAVPRCQSLIQGCYDSESAWRCVPAGIYCNNAIMTPYMQTGMNPYDIRSPCEDNENLCYTGLGWITEWLNKEEVMTALGVEVSTYESCNMAINRDFNLHGDWMKPIFKVVPKLLEEIPVLIYAGDADWICNWLGNQAWVHALEWKGQKDFNDVELEPLKLNSDDDEGYGQVKTSGNFTFMRIYQAGHMVPTNQPEASSDFLNRWLAGEWLA